MKYLKTFEIILITMLLIFLISISLCYFNVINNTFNNILKIISILTSSFLGGIYIGSKSNSKGYLEGLKIGGTLVLFMALLSYLGFSNNFHITKIIYYLVIIIITIIGSIIGINRQERKK